MHDVGIVNAVKTIFSRVRRHARMQRASGLTTCSKSPDSTCKKKKLAEHMVHVGHAFVDL